ncbi:MAG: DUF2975 domain-containing protein [Hungatella sp.]|nr:DUF2975 domain-containing protein [Hungatella sp.]MCI9501915.1 DUF2975 domain-containing protein [Hungatella sp.]
MERQRLTLFTKNLLDFMFFAGILMTAAVPAVFSWVSRYIIAFRVHYLPLTVLYFLSGILCLMIIWQLRLMFATVLEGDPFVDSNILSLKKMGRCSFLTSFLSVIRLPFSPTPATVFLVIVFFIAGLFSLVLSQVFSRAVEYKKENDLTI